MQTQDVNKDKSKKSDDISRQGISDREPVKASKDSTMKGDKTKSGGSCGC
jgi:hypothetical protein